MTQNQFRPNCGPPQNSEVTMASAFPYYPHTEVSHLLPLMLSTFLVQSPGLGCCGPWCLGSLFPVFNKSCQTDVQEMGMFLLFSRHLEHPHSWVSGNAVIGLLCCEWMLHVKSLFVFSKRKYLFLDKLRQPFPFLSPLAHWIFKALTFGTFYFQSQERQGDELSFLIKTLEYFYITEWLCLVCAIFIPGEKKKQRSLSHPVREKITLNILLQTTSFSSTMS